MFFIILIEGYAVLATELLAIRQLIPFVGSGTETVAIIISAVLLPLAIGYYIGGKCKTRVRERLLRNISSSVGILAFGLSYVFLELFFGLLDSLHLRHHIIQTAAYSVIFLAFPVFMLGQTVPLISNYFGKRRLGEITGRMLFFSTIGSFMGSVFSTLILMNTIGVHYTVIVTLTMLSLAGFLFEKRRICFRNIMLFSILLMAYLINSNAIMRKLHVVSNNAYSMVSIKEDKDQSRILGINRSKSAAISRDGITLFKTYQYIDDILLAGQRESAPREILVLGAGGFSIGLHDTIDKFTFIDIDPALKKVAERDFLHYPLPKNKHFIAASARAFVGRANGKYDIIIIDTFTHINSVPMETTTKEFLQACKSLVKPGGILIVNQIMSPDFRDLFSVRYHNTFASVFPTFTRQVINNYNPWDNTEKGNSKVGNVLYIYYDRPFNQDNGLYEDNLNTYSMDRN